MLFRRFLTAVAVVDFIIFTIGYLELRLMVRYNISPVGKRPQKSIAIRTMDFAVIRTFELVLALAHLRWLDTEFELVLALAHLRWLDTEYSFLRNSLHLHSIQV